jgi:hypothetical protein
MNALDVGELKQRLCQSLCADVSVVSRDDGSVLLDTPFYFPDGDGYSIYLERLPSGGLRLTDKGITMMRLSYEHDVDKLREGTRGKVFGQILAEGGIGDDSGELYFDIQAEKIGEGLFRFGQALTRIHDLSFLNRVQVESTFYDDLRESLEQIVGGDRLIREYVAPTVPDAQNYVVDYGVDAKRPLLIFGVPSATKARLATVIIQYLQKHDFAFHSMVVYSDMTQLPRPDVARLTNAANDQIASIDRSAMRRKIEEALAA